MSKGATRPVGRPRAVPAEESNMTVPEQILDAAAHLFVSHGFAGTTTRMIADHVGIRQATLYYHFATKDDIFVSLLETTLVASLDAAVALDQQVAEGEIDPAAALYSLAHTDAAELTTRDHNAGYLWLLPEARAPRYADFWARRAELEHIYGRIGTAASSPSVSSTLSADTLGEILAQVPELIIHHRRSKPSTAPPSAREIASTCLRICGVSPEQIELIMAQQHASV